MRDRCCDETASVVCGDCPRRQPCVGCLIEAIGKYHVELFAWLDAGGDKRLLDYEPLAAWGPILKIIRDARPGEIDPASRGLQRIQ